MNDFSKRIFLSKITASGSRRMYIIADHRIPIEAKTKLKKYGQVLFLESTGITYGAISGHPDIFICKTKDTLVVAPNAPKFIKEKLVATGIPLIEGKSEVGPKYPESAHYNAIITNKYLIHNLKYTDPIILESGKNLQRIDVEQAYSRCSLVALNDDRFITSDKGIEQTLIKKGIEVLYVNPKGILLPGFEYGFFGGTCGVCDNSIFFIGSLDHFTEGEKVMQFLKGYKIIELYDGPLFDGGSLIFVE